MKGYKLSLYDVQRLKEACPYYMTDKASMLRPNPFKEICLAPAPYGTKPPDIDGDTNTYCIGQGCAALQMLVNGHAAAWRRFAPSEDI